VFRVKNLLSFIESNRQAAQLILALTKEDVTFKDRLDQVQISNDCIVGDGCEIGKKNINKTNNNGKKL